MSFSTILKVSSDQIIGTGSNTFGQFGVGFSKIFGISQFEVLKYHDPNLQDHSDIKSHSMSSGHALILTHSGEVSIYLRFYFYINLCWYY
jgi:alpha-tubulin suppressor-like RCC1 family protein